MALRDQPYLPLYVQDFLTDEKLVECGAESTGVYIRLLCIMHKSEEYGTLKLKAKYKQNKSTATIEAFAVMLSKPMPYPVEIIHKSLHELIDEGVLAIEGDQLSQKRMVEDGTLSIKRAEAGSLGGKKGRNSGTKRYYNEKGYLYLIYDKDDPTAFKIGISAEPDKRIKGICRKSNRDNLFFRKKWLVDDMGEVEQRVLDYYEEIRDGEWIFGDYDITDIESRVGYIVKTKSKTKANSENEYVNESEGEVASEKKKKYKEIIEDLNASAKTNFKHTSTKTRELISTRIKEGFTLDDFKTVHRKKTIEWLDDPKMSKYLRPETLYSNKFEGYLNQPEQKKEPEEPQAIKNLRKMGVI